MPTIKEKIYSSLNFNINKLTFIAGPCQIEGEDFLLETAGKLKEIVNGYPVNFVFKSSFDKANRTKRESSRGIGLEAGLLALKKVKDNFNLLLTTDIHLPEQASRVAEVVDIVQIPAFLCRQTDLLLAGGSTGKVINIKKGQFLSPEDMSFVADKVLSTGNDKVFLTERGVCFGYRDLVVDLRSILIMKRLGYPVVFDATHSVQQIGSSKGVSLGNRDYVIPLAKAVATLGIDALFVECHPDPNNALSDGASMLHLNQIPILLDQVCKIWNIA